MHCTAGTTAGLLMVTRQFPAGPADGPQVSDGVGVGAGVGVGDGLGEGLGDGVGEGAGVGEGDGVGLGDDAGRTWTWIVAVACEVPPLATRL